MFVYLIKENEVHNSNAIHVFFQSSFMIRILSAHPAMRGIPYPSGLFDAFKII